MQQYRYSPALIIAATEGEVVTAAVDAKVTDIYSDAQTGKTISFDIGGGYELTYGQLDNIQVNVGDSVSTGDIVANVASPTIYYSEEGANIYYKLTKDGEPVDPLFREKDN
jgi:septal ring factor EnvC (AmiA/AmiB activator)